MKAPLALGLGLVAAAALALAGCSSDPATPSPTPSDTSSAAPTATSGGDAGAALAASLVAADTPLGTIVTDGDGKIVYMYDADTQGSGASACPDQCLTNWPPVPGGADAPTLTGIDGEVTTIIGTDGKPQLALNGWPLYYYVGDNNPGDANGQSVGGVWWVITPAGEPVRGD